MPKQSAGLLIYRWSDGELEVLLAHPGGPLYTRRDDGVWTIPKGEFDDQEEALSAALREFVEETGFDTPAGPFLPLGTIRQKSGKQVHAWACSGECEVTRLRSNHFEMEWPPRSGRMQKFPEVDRAEFFSIQQAREKLNPAQVPLLDRLVEGLRGLRASG